MDKEGIDKKIDQLEGELSNKEEKGRLLELKASYTGPDELISSGDYRNIAKKETYLYRVNSGLNDLDVIIEGFRPGTVVLISGPTKQGKTTLCQTFTHNFAVQGFTPLWFSFDTPPIELIERFPKLPRFMLPRRNEPEKKISWIESKIIEGIAKENTRVVFIDHLGFLSRFMDRKMNYATELTGIVRELKEIAIRWNVTIFLNHHIRSIDANIVPNWSHLKDSSGPAQDSDITIIVYREKIKEPNGGFSYTDTNMVSVQLHRRTGKTGSFRVQFRDNMYFDCKGATTEDEEF